MKGKWQLSEEEQEDLRREMRENLEKIQAEYEKKKGPRGALGYAGEDKVKRR